MTNLSTENWAEYGLNIRPMKKNLKQNTLQSSACIELTDKQTK